jgi:PPM family protein phosphatase
MDSEQKNQDSMNEHEIVKALHLSYAVKSHSGSKSPENEDRIRLPEPDTTHKIEPDTASLGHLFVVCDGMGGHNAGEIAAELCSSWLFKEFYGLQALPENIPAWWHEELDSLNSRLFALAAKYPQYAQMGSTLVMLHLFNDMAFFENIGDSRLYLFRNGQLQQLTEDDSEVWHYYRKGYISKDDILKNNRKHIISQAMVKSTMISQHHYPMLAFEAGDLFLLCSDGLTDVMTDSKIEKIISETDFKDLPERLINAAIEHETDDDTSVIVVKIGE